MMEPKKEIKELREKLRFHLHRYHVLDDPEIPDVEFDLMFDRLVELEHTHPHLVASDSPTQRVGAEPLTQFDEVVHSVPMLSLDKCATDAEIQAWRDRCERILDGEIPHYVCEPKIDGVAVSLLYEDGVLMRAATRVNGEIGEDITNNDRTIDQVPLRLLHEDVPRSIEIRGEIYMPLVGFHEYNTLAMKTGEKPVVNPRNGAAGSLRQLDARVTVTRWEVVARSSDHARTHRFWRPLGNGDVASTNVSKLLRTSARAASTSSDWRKTARRWVMRSMGSS